MIIVLTLSDSFSHHRGRPNHNTSRVKYLCDLLKQEGYGVQLNHETDKMDMIELSVDGKVIFSDANYQSNNNYHNMNPQADSLLAKVKNELK